MQESRTHSYFNDIRGRFQLLASVSGLWLQSLFLSTHSGRSRQDNINIHFALIHNKP